MADGFDFSFGSDPFGGEGGFEGLTQMTGTPVEVPQATSGFGDLAAATPQQQPAPKGIGTQIAEGVGSVTKPMAEIAKPLLPVVGLGTGAMGIAAGVQGARQSAEQQRMMRQAQKMQQQSAAATQAAAAPLTQFGQQQLQAAQQGQIPAAIQARIEQWKQGAMAQARDFAARSGQGDSQMLKQWEAYIDQQAKAMEAQYLQQEQQLGLQGLQAGAGALGSAGGQAGQLAGGANVQRNAIDDLMKQTNDVLARLNASAA